MSSPYRVSLLFAGFASLCAALTMAADATTAVSENGTNVYVAVSRAELHSGPSADFYPTLTVPQGTALEVYHRTADGWLGVRPPPGSFSWVAASDAYLLPGGRMIEITTDAAVSWIGTTLGSAKQYRWQVQLHQGEQLAVLGEKTRKTAAGNDILWYQISPPAGEFRWIRSTAVRDSPPERRNRTSPSTARDGVVPPQDPSVVTAQYAGVVRDDVFSTAPSGEYYPAAEGGEIVLGEGESYAAPYYEGPIVEGGVGEVYGPGYEDGYYPDGYYEDGGYEGGYYADGEYLEPVSPTVSADPFAGYHAFDFTENGLRFTLLERLFAGGRQQAAPDPRQQDPFDLSLPQSSTTSPAPTALAAPLPRAVHSSPSRPSVGSRSDRPWRDPRKLRRERAVLGAHDIPTNSALLASSREGDGQRSAPSQSPPSRLTSAALASSERLPQQSASQASATADSVAWYGVSPSAGTASPKAEPIQLDPTSLSLSELQFSLSDVVAQPMQQWNLQPIYDRVKHYIEHGSTAIERGQARLLLERVEEFAQLAQKSGYLAMQPTLNAPGMTSFGAAVVTASASANALLPNGGLAGYDASGWLVPVLAASGGQPAHALTDESGKILAYVSALPGMNLDRYLNQAVGVTGLRGYLPQLQAGHIQAQRVVRLQ